MTATATSSGSVSGGFAPGLPRRLRAVLWSLVAVTRWLAHRREVARMLQMDDRALKDIGLVRSDVQGALAGPFPHDPTHVLRRRSDENRLRQRSREASARRLSRG